MGKWLATGFAVAMLAACGSDGGGSGGDGGSGGVDGNGGGGGGGGTTSGKGLELNAALGLHVANRSWHGGSNVEGIVLVSRNGDNAVDPGLTVNGTAFVLNEVLNMMEPPEGTDIPNVGAGKTLELRARDGKGTESLDLPCPAEVQLTAPLDGAEVRPGDKVEVRWTGDVFAHDLVLVYSPNVAVYANDALDRWSYLFGHGASIEKGASKAEIEVPEREGTLGIELRVPGEFIIKSNGAGGESSGICWLSRRVELKIVD